MQSVSPDTLEKPDFELRPAVIRNNLTLAEAGVVGITLGHVVLLSGSLLHSPGAAGGLIGIAIGFLIKVTVELHSSADSLIVKGDLLLGPKRRGERQAVLIPGLALDPLDSQVGGWSFLGRRVSLNGSDGSYLTFRTDPFTTTQIRGLVNFLRTRQRTGAA